MRPTPISIVDHVENRRPVLVSARKPASPLPPPTNNEEQNGLVSGVLAVWPTYVGINLPHLRFLQPTVVTSQPLLYENWVLIHTVLFSPAASVSGTIGLCIDLDHVGVVILSASYLGP